MRYKALALALALSMPLGGCTQLQAVLGGDSVASTAPTTVADAEKGLTLTHLAYQGVGDLLISAAQSGALHGTAATTAKSLYDQAGDAINAANAADDLANAQGILDNYSKANDLILQVKALLPK